MKVEHTPWERVNGMLYTDVILDFGAGDRVIQPMYAADETQCAEVVQLGVRKALDFTKRLVDAVKAHGASHSPY